MEEVKFLELPDGRQISFREQGLDKQHATRSLLVLHGVGSSRIASMPGVSEDLLKEMGVRLIAIDRPGYGLSTPNPMQTFLTAAADIANIADILEMGEKIYILGYSCGGSYTWAAARYIPDRIAGIAMWAPLGNYWWKDFTDLERKAALAELSGRTRLMFLVMRNVPGWMIHAYIRLVIARLAGAGWIEYCKRQMSPVDQRGLVLVNDLMHRDSIEAMKQGGYGIAQDMQLVTRNWGFEPSDIPSVYNGPWHIFQGSEDWQVSPSMQRLIKKKVPELVHLHELPGEGHLSPFCYNDKGHRDTLSALFGIRQDEQHEVSQEDANKALENSSRTQAFEGDADEIAKVEPLIRKVVDGMQEGDTTAPSKQQESADVLDDIMKGAKL